MPFVVDTFFHSYYLREHRNERETVFMLGGNCVHMVNFKAREWTTVGKGSDELMVMK